MGTKPSKRGQTKWYLGEVNAKKNFVWTQKKRKDVVVLRQHFPAREVANILDLTVIQVYNATRMYKKGLKGECFCCGEKLTKEEKLASKKKIKTCFSCKEKAKIYKEGLRKKAKKQGLCVYCMKRKARKDYNACTKCISATHRRRYAQGLCGQCGKNPIDYPKESVCSTCGEVNRQRSADLRAARKKEQNA